MKLRLTIFALSVVLSSGEAQETEAASAKPDLSWRVADFASDGEGQVWGIAEKIDLCSGYVHAESIKHLAIFDPKIRQWKSHLFDATADGRAIRLTKLSDGAVACLWQRGEQTLLSRHRNGKSELWATLGKVFTEPRLLPLKDAGLAITERGAKVARVLQSGAEAKVITLDDALLSKPEKIEEGSRSYAAVRAVEAGDGSLWLWSYALEPLPNLWRVPAFLRWSDDAVQRVEGLPFMPEDPISAVVPDGKSYLYCAAAGRGLWHLPIREGKTMEVRAPNDPFTYVEHIEFIKGVLNVVTCPRPDKTSVEMSKILKNHLQILTTNYYNTTSPTGQLYRIEDGKLHLRVNGLDDEPRFGRTPRAILASDDGLLIGTMKGPPWWLENGGKWRQLDQGYGFRLHDAAGLVALQGGGFLVRSLDTTWTTLDPNVKLALTTGASRVSSFRTAGRVLEDSRHQLWAQRVEPKEFSKWDGKSWIKQVSPPVNLSECYDLGVDQHNQAWGVDREDKGSTVLDLNKGEWSSFPSFEEAIKHRLRPGDRVHLQRYPVFSPIAHRDGAKGYLDWRGMVHVLNMGAWSRASLMEIAGPDAAATGEPFFDSKGQFTLPINQRHFTLRNDGKWVEIDQPDTSNDSTYYRDETSPPNDCTVPNITSTSYDRYGVAWLTQSDGTLWKWLADVAVKVVADNPTPPLPLNTCIAQVFIDANGNAHLRQSGGSTLETYYAITALPHSAEVLAKLERVQLGVAEIVLNVPPQSWCRIRVDEGKWQPLTHQAKVMTLPMLPGKHRVEVQAFDAELNPLGKVQTFVANVEAAAASVISSRIDELTSSTPEIRETAARILRTQGTSALPELQRRLQSSTDESQRWWLQAVIQAIFREQQK